MQEKISHTFVDKHRKLMLVTKFFNKQVYMYIYVEILKDGIYKGKKKKKTPPPHKKCFKEPAY